MAWYRHIEQDKKFRPDLINQCFADRKSSIKNEAIFTRIAVSYNKAKKAQAKAADMYQVGSEWVHIYDNYMGEIVSALKSADIGSINRIYNNFFRERCSVGLHGLPVNMFKNYFSGKVSRMHAKLFLKDAVYRHNLWDITVGKLNGIASLKGPLLGNPYGYYVDGTFIEASAQYQHYYATMIGRLAKSGTHRTILELGGGFGGMAYYLMRDNTNLTYLDFDLPENFALTSFYLLSAFPDKKIALYGEVDLETDDITAYDAVLMPNFEIEKVKDNTVDLVFNSYSLAEMSREAVKNYFKVFNRVTNKFIYHVNHTKRGPMKADEFPVDTDKYELVYRAPALWNMALNPWMDEYECLYKHKQLEFRV